MKRFGKGRGRGSGSPVSLSTVHGRATEMELTSAQETAQRMLVQRAMQKGFRNGQKWGRGRGEVGKIWKGKTAYEAPKKKMTISVSGGKRQFLK